MKQLRHTTKTKGRTPWKKQETGGKPRSNETNKEKFLNNAGDSGAFVAVEGNAGDAIIFDTNCPHFAGAVDVGQNRKVARFDYANPCWNSYWDRSPWQRVKRKLFFV